MPVQLRPLTYGDIRSDILPVVQAADLIRESRRRRGLTQRALAEQAGTAQSAVAAYEGGAKQPSVATVDRLVRAAGLAVTWRLVPTSAPLVATALGIEAALEREDAAEALRHVAEVVAEIDERTPPERLDAELAVEPPTTGDRRWDALLAGVVEWLAHRHAVRTPAWTVLPERFLDEWWFVTPFRSLQPSALVDTPAELANRGVFLHGDSLRSI